MSRTTRRSFAKSLAAAAAAMPLATPGELVAQPEPAKPSALGKALTEIVRAQYAQHLSADELARIDKDFQEYVPALERLRQFKLVNADEPDFTFASVADRW